MGQSTRERIVRAATSRVEAAGEASFSVAEVRDELGLSSGSMFHAFSTRAALVAAVYVDGMLDYQHDAAAAIAEEPERRDDPERLISALIAAHAGWVETNAGLARFLFSSQAADVRAAAEPALAAANSDFFTAIEAFYERLAAEGLGVGLDRPTAHAIVIGPTQEYCRQWIRGNTDRTPTAASRVLAAAALAGLRAAA